MRGAQLIIDDTIAEGDRLAIRFHVTGEHKGEFIGVPATEREFVLTGQTVMRFRDGRVVERWTTVHLLGLLIQLGAVPARRARRAAIAAPPAARELGR